MYLGIDIGTSSVKAVLVDEHDTVVDQASAPLTVSRPQPGGPSRIPPTGGAPPTPRSRRCRRTLRGRARPSACRARCTARRCSTPPTRRCARPSCGTTAAASSECAELEKAEPRAARDHRQHRHAGLHRAEAASGCASTSPTVFGHALRAAAQGLRAAAHDRRQGQRHVRRRRHAVAGRRQRDWSPAMLAATGLTESHMPRLVEGSDATGTLRAEVAAAWGMDAVPVAGGGGDNAAGAAGIGVVGRATRSCRSAPRACCSWPRRSSCRIPPGPCTPSATACRASGTR